MTSSTPRWSIAPYLIVHDVVATANYYRDKMKELGYHAEIYYTGVIEQSGYHGIQREIVPHKKRLEQGIDYSDEHKRMIEAVRPRLAAQFRNLSDEDLLAAAIMLVATKPAQSART